MPTRRDIFAGLVASSLGPAVGAKGTNDATYYVDSRTGSDSADGLSPSTAWQTTGKVSAMAYEPGSKILFRRGQTFPLHATLRLRGSKNAQRSRYDCPVYVGAYGDIGQPLPKISAWKTIDPKQWVPQTKNVWRVPVNDALLGNSARAQGPQGANIGRLIVDGSIKTNKMAQLENLSSDWDFYSDGQDTLYLYLSQHPQDIATEIKASPNIDILGHDSGLTVRDLWFEGTGGHGANVLSNTDIQWCVYHTIGGSFLRTGQRYGNGIQQFGGAGNVIARNNLFWECYDTALTCQGYPMVAPNSGWDNIDFSDNWIARCAQGVEFWAMYGSRPGAGLPPPGSGFRTVQARRLHMFDIGRGASRLGRLDYKVWACFIESAMIETPYHPIPISISQMQNCSDRLLVGPVVKGRTHGFADFILEPSRLSLPVGSLIASGSTLRVEDWQRFVLETGVGLGSTMDIEPANQTGFQEDRLTPFEKIHAAWKSSMSARR